VKRDGSDQLLTENQLLSISIGESCCLQNPGKVPLHLIGLVTERYLGKDGFICSKKNFV